MRNFIFLLALVLFIQCDPAPKTSIQAAVVSARIEASEAGKTVMMQGGNAYDAMVAISFALTVVYPVAGNITGGGFFVYRNAEGETGTLDYREMAPLEATKDLYLDENGDVIPKLSTVGGLAVGIPGAVAGILEVHRKMGSLPLDQLLAPAIKLAEEGYIVSEKQAKSFKRYRDLFIEVNGEDTFFAQEYRTGDRIINLPLGNTLKAIAAKGEAGFYQGWVAEAMVNKTQATGGILSFDDLNAYTPKWRDPVKFDYKDLKVISMAPPSSGGICLGQMMQMIAPYDLKKMGHNTAESMHLMIEAERRSYADRSHFLGDPDFVSVPQAHLIDKSYISDRMLSYSPEKATPSR